MEKQKFWNSERIVSICAIFISLMTLVVLMYQTNIIREQQRMSVLPYLSLGNQGMGRANYKLIMKNDGIGPAFIVSTKVFYEGKEYETDLPRFLYEHIPEMDSVDNILHTNLNPGQMIPAGKMIEILEVDNSEEDAEKLFQVFKKHKLDFELVYKSIYGEKWILPRDGSFPVRLDD